MKLLLLFFFSSLISFFGSAQMRPIDKVFIVEGIVVDRETLITLPSVILYNDSLGIMTTSDERGYFKLVIPDKLIQNREMIPIDAIKTGYKRNGWGIMYNPVAVNDANSNNDLKEIWSYDVKILLMASNESQFSSTMMANAPPKVGKHGYPMIKLALDEAVVSERRSRKLNMLKQGNEKLYFPIDGYFAIVTITNPKEVHFANDVPLNMVHFYKSPPMIFINKKRARLIDINRRLKRSIAVVDWAESHALSKRFGKDVIVFAGNE